MGCFGYIDAINELITQPGFIEPDYIVFATGSGGTATGLGLACHFSGLKAKVLGVTTCHTPEYFYDHVNKLALEMGSQPEKDGVCENWMEFIDGAGEGYAISSKEELVYLKKVYQKTCLLVDPVYSGKALFTFSKYCEKNKEKMKGKKVLFWHTGG